MQLSVIFQVDLLLPIIGDPGTVCRVGGGGFFPLSCPWICYDDNRTYPTTSYSIMVLYILLCSIHPTYVTLLIFLWTFINIPKQHTVIGMSQQCCSRDYIYLKPVLVASIANKSRDLDQTPGPQ